jgi:CRISPR-associated protein Cas5d
MKIYPVALEIEGPAAIFARPDSGATFVSYPGPTFSAAKGLFECVAYWKTAYIRPVGIEICKPIQFQRYATNYGGPLRKGNQIALGASYQLFATILIDVCYKLHGVVTESAPSPNGNNQLHALQELFERRLKRGRLYRSPCLGWSEFTATYFGPLRPETEACSDIDLTVPSMLHRVFDRDSSGKYGPEFRQDVRIEKGVLRFAE